MSAVRLPSCTENFHIFFEGLRKHFLKCLLRGINMPSSIAKLEIIFKTNNTQGDIAKKGARFFSPLNFYVAAGSTPPSLPSRCEW